MDDSSGKGNQTGRVARHCMVVHAYYPLGETRVEREAQALLAQGIEVDIISLRKKDEPAIAKVDGIELHRMPVKRHKGSGLFVQMVEYITFFVMAFFRLTKLHLRKRYDVVQVHNLPDFLVFVALIPKLMGAKIILDLHDLMPEFYAERFQRSLDSFPVRIIRWQEKASCRFADRVITVTELWRQALIQRGQPADKVTVVMNVADDRVFYPGAAIHITENNRFRLIYHGVLGKVQGSDLILMALNEVRRDAPDICLTLHGFGEYRKILERMVDELDLKDYVQFSTASLPTSELPKLIKKADLAIVPYRNGIFSGGILPTKLMEYAALGVPAIAARTPAIETYFDETMVQFFAPGDVNELAACIRRLYHDRSRLAELEQNIGKFNDRYNWQHVRADYCALVESLNSHQNTGSVK